MKTKAEESKILEETIQKLTPNSYLGPWLVMVKAELESMMRADSYPCVSLAESAELVERIKANATREAKSIVAKAEREAEAIETAAEGRIERARMLIRDASQSLLAIQERL